MDNQGARVPQFIFANYFIGETRVKLRVFVLKVAILGPHVTFFLNVIQQPGPDLPYGTGPGAPLSDDKTFFSGLHLFLARRFCKKISTVPGGPRNVNPARSITWLASVIVYFTIF